MQLKFDVQRVARKSFTKIVVQGSCLTGIFISLLASCSTAPKTAAGLNSQMPLHPVATASPVAGDFSNDALVYRAPDLDASAYHGFFVPPSTIYVGSDAQFGGADDPEKQDVAAYLTQAFARALANHHLHVASQPGPGIIILQLTLAGISNTHPIASLTRLTPIGAGITVLKSAAGLPAAFVGSITVAGELTDAEGKVLGGFVTKESPLAYDLRSSLGTTMTAQLAADRAAGDFASAIVSLKSSPTN